MPEKTNQPQENKPEQAADEQLRIGVYVCACGGNIGDAARCPLVTQALGQLPTWPSPASICSCVPTRRRR